ncbi:TPA: primase-helicase zinc-binding domain-containing protein, partial [Aeromonas veronii]
MNKARFVSDVAAAATGHWPDLLAAVGIDTPRGGKHGPCPTCGGKDRFRLDNKGGRGTWICNQCGAGDGLALVGLVTGKPIKEAAELIAPLVGVSAGGLDATERERIHQQQQTRAGQEELRRHKAARRAAAIMQDSEQAHAPYLARKNLGVCLCAVNRILIRDAGENFPPASLIVPLYNEANELVNVQLIREDGTKRYLAGGQKQQAFHRLNGGELVAVVEGYATGLSVHLATGATVYCAMDSGNLLNVAKIARRQHPTAKIIICGDYDLDEAGHRNEITQHQTDGAALAVGAVVALPPIQGDWNDYHQAHGLTKTQEAIMSACATPLTNRPQDPGQRKEGAIVTRHPLHHNEEPKEQMLPTGFEIKGDRLCVWELVGRGDNARQELVPISSPVQVLAETSDEHGRGYGRLLEWQDSAGRTR